MNAMNLPPVSTGFTSARSPRPLRWAGIAFLVAALMAPPAVALGQDDPPPPPGGVVTSSTPGTPPDDAPSPAASTSPAADADLVPSGGATPAPSGAASTPAAAGPKTTGFGITGLGDPLQVTFNSGGGSAVPDQEVLTGQLASEPPVSRTGYDLVGWFTDSTWATQWDFAVDTVESNLTLWAKWQVKTGYTLRYNMGFDTAMLAPSPKKNLSWTDADLIVAPPAIKGYQFAGWYTTANTVGATRLTETTPYAALAITDTTMTVTVYARWTAKSGFSVIYHLNHPTGAADPASLTGLNWTSIGLLPRSIAAPLNWRLVGWFTEPDAGIAVSGLTSYGNAATSDDPALPLHLYARWADTSIPTATVSYRGAAAQPFRNRLAYGLFLKAGPTVTIYGAAEVSTVTKVEYLITTQSFATTAAALAWAALPDRVWQGGPGTSASFTIPDNRIGHRYLFARITSASGNTGIYFGSITLYADSTQTGQTATFNRGSAADITVDAALHGNTVAQIVNTSTSAGGMLTANSYSVAPSGGTDGLGAITIKNSYLASLPNGTHTFMVSYNPAGYTYSPDELTDTRNQEPATTTFIIVVATHAQAPLSITGLASTYTYGDPAPPIGVSGGSGSGWIQWIISNDVGAEGVITPLVSRTGDAILYSAAAGRFTVHATKAGDGYYDEVSTPPHVVNVNRAVPTVTLHAIGSGAVGQPISLGVVVGRYGIGTPPTGTVDFLVDSKPVVGGPLVLNSAGVATYTVPGSANLAPGNHTFEVRYNGCQYYKGYGATTTAGADPSVRATTTFTVGKASQTIAIRHPGDKTWGDQDFKLSLESPGAGSGAITWAVRPAGVLALTGDTAKIVGTGSVTITAVKAADAKFNSDTHGVTIMVAKATPRWTVPATGSPLNFGQMLSASNLSGWVVKGVGTHAEDTVSGVVAWTDPQTVPELTAISGAPTSYAVTFRPTGLDTAHYAEISAMASVTTNQVTPVLVGHSASGTPILPAPYDTLADSVITGAAVAFEYGGGGRFTPISGHWTWDRPTMSWTDFGIKHESATFTPDDLTRFRTISAVIDLQVFGSKTIIINGPTASPVRFGERVQDSDLDAALASVEVHDQLGAFPIGGSWEWTEPETRISHADLFMAEVTFTPAEFALDPLVNNGYVQTTMDLAIPVLKAIPILREFHAVSVRYGEALKTVPIDAYTVVGPFGGRLAGTLTWTDPNAIPSQALGGTGLYPAVVTFTPETGTFVGSYETVDFPVFVDVVPDTTPLSRLLNETAEAIFTMAHPDNYETAAYEEFRAALKASYAVLDFVPATQFEVDAAVESLQQAIAALVHSHPVIVHSHPGGVTEHGDEVSIEFAGDIRDVTGLVFNNISYGLTPTAAGYAIVDGARQVGTITGPAVTVNLAADLVSWLGDGVYELRVWFHDGFADGEGVAEVSVARLNAIGSPTTQPPGSGTAPGSGRAGGLAVTGAAMDLPLRTAIYLIVLGVVLTGSVGLRRLYRDRSERSHKAI